MPPARLLRGGAAALLLSALACPARRAPEVPLPPCAGDEAADRSSDPLARCIARGDRHFRARTDPERLDAAIAIYTEAQAISAEDPRLLARLTRAYAAKAYGYPETSREAYRLAREMGLRCLRGVPELQGAVVGAGGVLTVVAVEAVDEDRAECALWTAWAWARGLNDLSRTGAAVDLNVLQALARRVYRLSPELEDGLPAAAYGLAIALPPLPLQPDLDRAERLLRESIEASPERLTPRVDLALLVAARRGEVETWRSLLAEVVATELSAGGPHALENRRAVARAREALEAGPPQPEAWWRP